MNRVKKILWLGLAACLALRPAPLSAAHDAANHLLPAGLVDPQTLVPPPPAPDSFVEHTEIDVLLNLQLRRTPEQVALARKVQEENAFIFGSDVLGDWFNAANLPRMAAFFVQVNDELTPVNHATKKLFSRRRPPFQDARIKPCVEYSDTTSYPSGHATRSAIWAGLLGAVFPDQAPAFAARAAVTRWARLVGGAHHPTDVEAGRIIGEAVARELLKNPAVQQILTELRAEAAPFLQKKAA